MTKRSKNSPTRGIPVDQWVPPWFSGSLEDYRRRARYARACDDALKHPDDLTTEGTEVEECTASADRKAEDAP